MALEPQTTHITTSKSATEARAGIEAALGAVGATIKSSDDQAIEAVSGKKVGTRILGAMFVPDAWLPLHHSIVFSPSGTDTRIDITVKDDFGIGLRAGFTKKYTRLMEQRLSDLTAAAG